MLQDLALVQIVGILIVAGAAALMVLRKLNVPSIVVYILVGVVMGPILQIVPLGPGVGNADGVAEAMDVITDLGIILLLFLVGLELSFDRIRDVGRVSLTAGFGQVLITGVVSFGLCLVLQFRAIEAVFIAVAMTNSSTVLAIKLLEQKGETQQPYGHIAVGANLAKDLALIIILTFLGAFGGDGFDNIPALIGRIVLAFAGLGVMLVVALAASRYVLNRPFAWVARSPPTLLIWSLCWCFLFVQGAELANLSPAIGGFIAGISLAQVHAADELRRRVHPLMNFFLAIFFLSVGAQMELTGVREAWISGIVLCAFVLLANPLIAMWLIVRGGYSERTSFLSGVAMGQVSELSFVFAAVGIAAGLIGEPIMSLIAMVGLVTIVISSYMILYNHQLYAWCQRLGLLKWFDAPAESPLETPADPEETLSGHVIVIGMNALGRRVVKQLHEQGETTLAIDTDPAKLDGLPGKQMVGNIDYGAMVEEAGLARAKLAVSALQIEDTNKLLAYRCKQLGVSVAVHAFDDSVVGDLEELGADYLIESKTQGSHRLAATTKEGLGG